MMFFLPANAFQAAIGIFLALMLALVFQPRRLRSGLRWYTSQWCRHPIQTALLSYLLFCAISYGGAKQPPGPDPEQPPAAIRLRLYTDDCLRLRPLGWPITTTPEAP